MKVLLASASPRRKQLLNTLFKEFDIVSPNVDESSGLTCPSDFVKEIALRKADSVVNKQDYDLIIACDTMVFLDNLKIGKPKDEEDALRILKMLNGKTHTVVTGMALLTKNKVIADAETSYVTFKNKTEEELKDYINKHNILDKAGAYAIQDDVLVKEYKGDYANIVGLPIAKLKRILKEEGIET